MSNRAHRRPDGEPHEHPGSESIPPSGDELRRMLGAADPNVVSGTAGGTIERARAMGGGVRREADEEPGDMDKSLRIVGLLLAALAVVLVVGFLIH